VLSGVKEQQPRWKRGVNATEARWARAWASCTSKALPGRAQGAHGSAGQEPAGVPTKSIDTLDWMSPATKKEAQAKLAKFTVKIGYPNKWRDYSQLVVARTTWSAT
jgi:putative endopeptidase